MMGQHWPRSRTMMGLVGKLMMLCLMGARSQAPASGPSGTDDDCQLEMSPIVRVCNDEQSMSFLDTSDVQVRRRDETTAHLCGTYKLLEDIPKNAMVTLEVNKKVDPTSQPVRMFSYKVCSVCEELNNTDGDMHKMIKPLSMGTTCPVKAGKYEIMNMVMDTSGMPITHSNIGEYVSTIHMAKNTDGSCENGEHLACISFSFRIECLI